MSVKPKQSTSTVHVLLVLRFVHSTVVKSSLAHATVCGACHFRLGMRIYMYACEHVAGWDGTHINASPGLCSVRQPGLQ